MVHLVEYHWDDKTENTLVFSYGTTYGLKNSIDEVNGLSSSVGASEGRKDENHNGSIE